MERTSDHGVLWHTWVKEKPFVEHVKSLENCRINHDFGSNRQDEDDVLTLSKDRSEREISVNILYLQVEISFGIIIIMINVTLAGDILFLSCLLISYQSIPVASF